ncbi:uncharacterized protein [Branchiostoma lanceolatum]|uniref:Hypp1260 protein n=1 Tax=Branchiostoma lanceolatum TaxID=7740 RepID=A0A8J9ZFV1_BRALA|nr:Hypp1260 [Branchiostoma lanceolatum]
MVERQSAKKPYDTQSSWSTPHSTVSGRDDRRFGYQKLTSYEIDQTVERLHSGRLKYHTVAEQRNKPRPKDNSDPELVSQITERLTRDASAKATDQRRTHDEPLRNMGTVNSYAWKGWN